MQVRIFISKLRVDFQIQFSKKIQTWKLKLAEGFLRVELLNCTLSKPLGVTEN